MEKTLVSTGSSGNPHGGWHHQWVRTYRTSIPRQEVEARLAADLPRVGLTKERQTRRTEWRSENGAFRLELLDKNPNFWLSDDPRTTVYVQTWEPRPVPLGERIDDWWLGATRSFRRSGSPTFVPVPVRNVRATAKEP